MAGRLTTHVLDTARGRPAAGLAISLWRIGGESRTLLVQLVTNADGRSDAPLLSGEAMQPGEYELVFAAGDYLRASGQISGDNAFLDLIPIRFGIGDAGQHYHVPLLLSPFAYSTYRGS
ncbi:hydroxyisourate hydrolase [Pseudogemmobacter bohemicus]|uniref:hydroxyisourate hydrolase n=1 Tax=Pseudogemmobacter bohemicus TaxID=2250708 RepID=UPI000DD2D07E|nr:hydroxyisourate hydrolase [Pseudogemmobacter bohemicus]